MEITTKYLKNFLPETSYGKDSYTAFHQVLKGIKLESFSKWISTHVESLHRVLDPKKLTLLHVCAMLGRDKHAKVVLDLKKIDVNAKDDSGWTVLHFAAFINDTALGQLFVTYGALYTPNIRGALPSKLQELAYPPEKKLSFFYEDKDQIVEGDNQKFFELTGKKLVDEVVISRDELFKDWKDNASSISYVPQKWIEAYRKFKQSPPPILYMTNVNSSIGWEVATQNDLPAETVICEYLGEYIPLPPKNEEDPPLTPDQLREEDTYRLESINANKKCNLTALFNDGAPKMRIVKVNNEQGIYHRYFFITLEKCPKKTILRWDYVQHFVKHEAHTEVSIPSLIQTYKELKSQHGPFDSILMKLDKKVLHAVAELDLHIDEQNIYQKIFYLFTTPQPLIILVVTQTISLQEIYNCKEIVSKDLEIDFKIQLIIKTFSYINLSSLSKQQVDRIIQIASTKNGHDAGAALISFIPLTSIDRYNDELKKLMS